MFSSPLRVLSQIKASCILNIHDRLTSSLRWVYLSSPLYQSPICPEIEVQVLRRRGRRRGLSYRQLPVASAVTGLVVRYLAVFNVVSSFYHWCYCHFTIVQHVLCYLAHVDFLMMPVIYHGFTNYVFLCKMLCQKWRNKLWNQINQ